MKPHSNTGHKAKALCIWGTASNTGKSLFTAGLGRILVNMGFSVAPFKAQNMSNNSAVTFEGGEIGRAQACQADACKIPTTNDLNPLLLKPSGDKKSQVVLHGKVHGNIGADFGTGRVDEFKKRIAESYDRLASKYDVILIEGAGGCAELNLRHRDLANLWIAEYTDAQVVLISDIERGGIFASLLGTLDLLRPNERKRIIGLVVNKFRGSKEIFDEGIRILEERSGKPVLGVLPYIHNHNMPDEDNASFEVRDFKSPGNCSQRTVRAGIIMPGHVSNITDVEALIADSRFQVQTLYAPPVEDNFDVIIIPGSKNVIDDLIELKQRGFDPFLKQRRQNKRLTIGVCGGYQMLGSKITDPHGIETDCSELDGFGLLDVRTEIQASKVTVNVRGALCENGIEISGYEIHCGQTVGKDVQSPLVKIHTEQSEPCGRLDGAVSEDGAVWGTYLHGLFDNEELRNLICRRFKNINSNVVDSCDPYETIASVIACNLNLEPVLNFVNRTAGTSKVNL